MVFTGHLWKESKLWVISVPSLEITTQGRSKGEALRMIRDAIEGHVDKKGFRVHVSAPLKMEGAVESFTVSAKTDSDLVALFLRRQRQLNDLTVREVAKRLGYASPSAYAQYETGRHVPGLDKISKFLRAMNPHTQCALEVVMC